MYRKIAAANRSETTMIGTTTAATDVLGPGGLGVLGGLGVVLGTGSNCPFGQASL